MGNRIQERIPDAQGIHGKQPGEESEGRVPITVYETIRIQHLENNIKKILKYIFKKVLKYQKDFKKIIFLKFKCIRKKGRSGFDSLNNPPTLLNGHFLFYYQGTDDQSCLGNVGINSLGRKEYFFYPLL
jgi:hypothetical protein